MTQNQLNIQPGEITIILGNDLNNLNHHACRMANMYAERKMPVQLINAGMMSRRFWAIAREHAPKHITDRNGGDHIYIRSTMRGSLSRESDSIIEAHQWMKSKVLIICGWEWASRSWRFKEDLLFELRVIAEETGMAIIIYSQARTNPTPGCMDRGGVGKIASIALCIFRINEEERETGSRTEVVVTNKNDEAEAAKFAQLVAKGINDLGSARAENILSQRPTDSKMLREEEYEYA